MDVNGVRGIENLVPTCANHNTVVNQFGTIYANEIYMFFRNNVVPCETFFEQVGPPKLDNYDWDDVLAEFMATITDPNIDMNNHASDLDAARAKWRQQYLNGIYTEVTNDDIESFRATLWRDQQEVLAHQAFGTAKKILEQINGLLNAQTDAFQARDIKDMSRALNKILGCVCGRC